MLRYKKFKLIKPNEGQARKIEDVIMTNNGSIFHSYYLNRIIEQKFNSDLFYLVDNPLNIKNCAPVHVSKNRLGGKKYQLRPLYDIPYAGFVGNEKITLDKLDVNFFESLNYEGFPYTQKLSNVSSKIEIGETTFVDLSLSEDDIFSNVIHSKRRNMIRKAIKVGIEVKVFQDIDGFKLFWPMLEALHKKLGYDFLTFDYYEKMIAHYAKSKQIFTLIAFKNDQPISGIFIIGNINFMHYYKGASLIGERNEGQGELLQWEAIKLAKSLKVKKYDLCNLNKERLPSIYKFKTGIANNIYEYPKYTLSNMGFKIMNKLSNA